MFTGKEVLGREEAVLLGGYLSVPAPTDQYNVKGSLQSLNLMNNPVVGTGMLALADSLKANHTLTYLNLVRPHALQITSTHDSTVIFISMSTHTVI